MNQSTKKPDGLRKAIADLESEIRTKEAEAQPDNGRLHALEQAVKAADAVLRTPYRYPDHQDAQAAKSSAYAQRREIVERVQAAERELNTLKQRLSDLRNQLHRAEYDAVTTAELAGGLARHIKAIRAVDSELADLAFERDTLQQRRQEARQAADAVTTAQGELQAAQEAREEVQGAAFIAGCDADLTSHAASIATAEKRLATATKNAAAGGAALPRITARLEAIGGERADLEGQRLAVVGKYWHTKQRIAAIEFRDTARQLVEIGNTLAALDRKTGNRLGYDLCAALQSGLRMPVQGGYTEPVHMPEPNPAGILAALENDLSTALQALAL